jgi:hypothetical protein
VIIGATATDDEPQRPNHSLPRKERGIFESGLGRLGAMI